jgi:hypothetical protein
MWLYSLSLATAPFSERLVFHTHKTMADNGSQMMPKTRTQTAITKMPPRDEDGTSVYIAEGYRYTL